jgi:hypothetical protein
MFGFHVRLLRLWEWLTCMPNETPLPQNWHLAICRTSLIKNQNIRYPVQPKSIYISRKRPALQQRK